MAPAAFPRGHLSIRRRDERGPSFTDASCAPWCAVRGRPAEARWRLALVPVLPDAAGVSDRQAALAVRSRIAGKYALG
jgi:hypothetical protein